MAERIGRAFPQTDVTHRMRRVGTGGVGGESVPAGPPIETHLSEFQATPDDAITFTKTGFWDSPAAVGNNKPAALSFQLPENMQGVIRSFSQYINDMVAADSIVWTILVNDVPQENWDAVTMFPTLASFRTVNDDPFIKLPERARIDILISNNAPAIAHKIGASYYGWYWPNRGRVGR